MGVRAMIGLRRRIWFTMTPLYLFHNHRSFDVLLHIWWVPSIPVSSEVPFVKRGWNFAGLPPLVSAICVFLGYVLSAGRAGAVLGAECDLLIKTRGPTVPLLSLGSFAICMLWILSCGYMGC